MIARGIGSVEARDATHVVFDERQGREIARSIDRRFARERGERDAGLRRESGADGESHGGACEAGAVEAASVTKPAVPGDPPTPTHFFPVAISST